MEGSGVGIGRIDCYEDMFKEITRKLYGEDPDHRTSSIQNEFETSASYKNEVEDEAVNGNDGTDDSGWTCSEESLECTGGSRVAAYHATKSTWRCCECGECLGGGPREVAEHFLGLHSSRVVDDSNTGHHTVRSTECRKDSLADQLTAYLERVRERAERPSPPARRSQETQTIPTALLPPATSFLLHDSHTTSPSQHSHLHQSPGAGSTIPAASSKRYACPYCPYGTDRRDLYTRHENIHREEKPFHCYVCYKPFNRADHVKKHFLRMHREHQYELARIRTPAGTTSKSLQDLTRNANSGGTAPTATHHNASYPGSYNNVKGYQLHSTSSTGLYPTPNMPTTPIQTPGRRTQNGGCNSKSHLKGASKGAQERRYTCCYCSWSGVDNWCLKRHLNTHLKPFACALCEYKAARAERLSTHVLKVHNRRQCSRCSYLAEDAAQLQLHQLHVHRVTTATAPTAPPTPRHHQHLQPAGGGRPPPGPPVFPAPAPPTAVTSSVIPPTTILGHEVVGCPAAAASLQSQDMLTYEDSRSEFLIEGGLETQCMPTSSAALLSRCLESPATSSSEYSNNGSGIGSSDSQTSEPMRDGPDAWCWDDAMLEGRNVGNSGSDNRCKNEKRARKQRQPRKLTTPAGKNVPERCHREDIVGGTRRTGMKIVPKKVIELRERYLAQLVSRKAFVKCYRCSRHASARASAWVPYHTKASLALHSLWRHSRSKTLSHTRRSLLTRDQPRAVTLKATVYTHRTKNHDNVHHSIPS